MAAFNEEKFIGEAIDSVLKQTYSNLEFIIINDGSTDKTEDIILSYKDSRIVYKKNLTNLKLIKSLNIGLSTAKGKYIARMDADDICYLDRIEKQVEFMETNPEIGISGAQLTTFGSSNGLMQYPLNHEEIKLHLIITSCFGNNVVIFRKEILDQFKLFFPEGYLHAEDYKSWTNWIIHTKVKNLEIPLVKYRSHNNSISWQNRKIQRLTRNRVRTEYISTIFELKKDCILAKNFTGNISKKRVNAIKKILNLNRKKKKFPEEKLKLKIIQLWYLDCLEKAETEFSVVFKFMLIFEIGNVNIKELMKVLNIFKHYIIFKLREVYV